MKGAFMRSWLLACLVLPTAAACAVVGDTEEPDAGPAPLAEGECRRHLDCPGSQVCDLALGADRGACVPFHCDGPDEASLCEGLDCWCDVASRRCRCPTTCLPGDPNGCDDGETCLLANGFRECVPSEALPPAAACEASPAIVHVSAGGEAPVQLLGVDEQGGPVPLGFCSLAVPGDEACDAAVCVSPVPSACAQAACTVERRTYGPLPDGAARVVVVEEGTGAPIEGARVWLRAGDAASEAHTNADGVVVFPDAAAVESLTVMPAAHEWHTLVGDALDDVIVATRRRAAPGTIAAALATGRFDAASTQGDISVMVAGVSLDDLTRLSARSLFGEDEVRTVRPVGVTEEDEPMSIPAGMTLMIGPHIVKREALAIGAPGARLPWAIGGRLRLSQIASHFQAGGETLPSGFAFVSEVFPRADHAVGRPVQLEERPRGEELAPYDGMASDTLIGADALALDTLATARVEVLAPDLPCPPSAPACAPEETEERLLVVALADVAGWGHVPLGMLVARDDPAPEDGAVGSRDGVVEEVPLEGQEALLAGHVRFAFAPPHDGLEGAPLSVAALSLGPSVEGTPAVTGVLRPLAGTDEDVKFGRELLPYPRAVFAGSTVTLDDVGAQVTRVTLRGAADDDGTWHVWVPGEGGALDLAPLLPNDVELPAGTRALTALVLDEVDEGTSPASLFDLGHGGALVLERDLRAWATVGCGEGSSCLVE